MEPRHSLDEEEEDQRGAGHHLVGREGRGKAEDNNRVRARECRLYNMTEARHSLNKKGGEDQRRVDHDLVGREGGGAAEDNKRWQGSECRLHNMISKDHRELAWQALPQQGEDLSGRAVP